MRSFLTPARQLILPPLHLPTSLSSDISFSSYLPFISVEHCISTSQIACPIQSSNRVQHGPPMTPWPERSQPSFPIIPC
ncbi:uncharacterized protein BDR25DRAFT_95127 [Lindgomyces ingoldianus]|uniref:Uncharacterized protein n=1 Tax=Lindgomyces ingoldianus TaxID=673940 RepID=A0ACB6QCQ9_9PLEO|nr:uncharacterized protein BDR25DRAFT_95127 [Lindgomyces ingoldianus]KAF2464758.1 hypothetical protein BDR25DRAFT_95127 [Lindgomyces ingoldianus]